MKNLDIKFLLLSLIISFYSLSTSAQKNESLWTKTNKENASKGKQSFRKTQPNKGIFYALDIDKLKSKLQSISKTGSSSKLSNTIISFPNSNGILEAFNVREESIMEPRFQAEHTNIRSYIGQSIVTPESIIYFTLTPQGLHTMVLSSKSGAQFIDPYTSDANTYVVYNKKDLPKLNDIFKCEVPQDFTSSKSFDGNSKSSLNANDGKLRTFRLALASTVEYSTFHINAANLSGGTDVQKKAAVLAAMVVTMTRVNGIFKRDLSLQMELVPNDAIIFLVEDDGFTDNDASKLINESQTIINAVIGSANYDIGHTFSTSGGGIAQLSSPCNDTVKARGVTGLTSPVGDAYDIDFVAHEMGHQFGAPHTWNGSAGNCTVGEWSSTNAYEPGSGSTIMAYAGICSPQNVQSSGDAYFHQKSLQMIWDNITIGNSTCANASAVLTGNNAPTAEAGASYTIPISTPYKLTGSSTDIENTNTHTFTWEQYDLGLSQGLPLEINTTGPIIRSFEGTTNPIRYIPRLADLITTNGSTDWEKLASVNRTINFQLTVRDNDSKGGQTATDNMTVTTDTSAGPFVVTSQNTSGISWPVGSTQTITWNVAGTTGSPINTANVNILLSTDGGLSYPTTLASNVPNNGSYDISTVPSTPAPYCRIMIEAVGNVFFAINSEDFSIGTFITTCTQYASSSNLNLSIEDGPTGAVLSNTVNITDSKTIDYIKVNVDVSHTYIQDLIIRIKHPNGSISTNVWDKNCFNENNIDVIFEDGGATIVCATPTTGTYSPNSPLNVFSDLNSAGDWTIEIEDKEAGDMGTLNDWYIEVCETTLSNPSFNGFSDLKVFPNPNKGEFTIKLNSSLSNHVKVEVYDIRGRLILKNTYKEAGDFNEKINLNNVQSGMYILNVSDGLRKSTRKIIVE